MVLPKGKVAVNQEVLSEYLRFSHSDAERSFEHQEHIFRLTKIKLLKDKNPLKLQKQLKQLKSYNNVFSIKSLSKLLLIYTATENKNLIENHQSQSRVAFFYS